jgi:chromosome segregation ATPase
MTVASGVDETPVASQEIFQMQATVRMTSVAWIAVMGLFLCVAGCKTTGTERAEMAAQSLEALQADITKTNQQLGVTLTSLNDLVKNPKEDLKPQYQTFTKAMDGLEAQVASLKSRSEAMKARGREYFKAWEESSKTVNDPDMKAHSEERRAKLETRFEEVKTNLGATVDQGKKLMDSLRDMRRYLSLDLTANGLKLAAGPAEKATADAKELQADVDTITKKLDEVAKTLSSSSAPPPAAPPAAPPAK